MIQEKEHHHILVVDDDKRLCNLLERYLKEQGFCVTTAFNAEDARRKLAFFDIHLIILDVMMPGESGFEFAASFRKTQQTPILMLTAKNEADDRIHGLQKGVDDYLPKPFEPLELLLRIRNILRHQSQDSSHEYRILTMGNASFHTDNKILKINGLSVHLTTAERDLLFILSSSPSVPIDRETLLKKLNIPMNTSRAIDVQIARLRRKLQDDPRTPRWLHTIRGKGYVLIPDYEEILS